MDRSIRQAVLIGLLTICLLSSGALGRIAPSILANTSALPAIASTSTDSWPMAGHDPGQSNADAAGGIPRSVARSLRLRWQRADAVPAIEAAGKLYAIVDPMLPVGYPHQGGLIALNATTGEVLHHYQSTLVWGVAYAAPWLYINRGTYGLSGEIRIVDAVSAAWQHTATNPLAGNVDSFIVADGHIYAAATTTQVAYTPALAFDAQDGHLLWATRLHLNLATPTLSATSLYLTAQGQNPPVRSYRLDLSTGKVLTAFKPGEGNWHMAGDRLYSEVEAQADSSFAVVAHTRAGKVAWTIRDAHFGAALPDRLFSWFAGGNSLLTISAFAANSGQRLWQTELPPALREYERMAVAGNLVYAQALDGHVAVLDTDDGHLLTELSPPAPSSGAGNLIVGATLVYESIWPIQNGFEHRPVLLAFGRP